MPPRERDEEREHKWVRVEHDEAQGRKPQFAVQFKVPREEPERELRQAKLEWVRVEKKFLQSIARSRDLPEFAKHEVRIRLKELEAED